MVRAMPDAPKPFLYLAVPCYGGNLNLYFVKSLLALQEACRERGVGLYVDMMGGEALITRGRSRLAAHPELRAKMGDMGDKLAREAVMVFDTMVEPETGQYLSEDYAFCRRWRDLGGEIWADFEARLTHVGHATYTGSLMQALRSG